MFYLAFLATVVPYNLEAVWACWGNPAIGQFAVGIKQGFKKVGLICKSACVASRGIKLFYFLAMDARPCILARSMKLKLEGLQHSLWGNQRNADSSFQPSPFKSFEYLAHALKLYESPTHGSLNYKILPESQTCPKRVSTSFQMCPTKISQKIVHWTSSIRLAPNSNGLTWDRKFYGWATSGRCDSRAPVPRHCLGSFVVPLLKILVVRSARCV